jgi:hypothetical protein
MIPGGEDVRMRNVGGLSLISAYAARMRLVEEIDRLVRCQMEVSSGRVVLPLTLDAPTGRSPLYTVSEIFADKDVEVLSGEDFPVSKLLDAVDAMGHLEELCHGRRAPR